MALSSVSPATSSAVQQQQPAVRQAEQKPVERPRDTESADQIREAQTRAQQTRARQQAQETQRNEAQRVEQPRPVTNAQGQKTGTIINDSA
jgi:hypothetical protein